MARRGSQSSRGITIRRGTGERHWYAVAGYVFISAAGLLYVAFMLYSQGQEGAMLAGLTLGLVFLGMAIGAFVSFGAMFKDSAYLRGTAAGWSPRWWYFIGGPAVGPIALYLLLDMTGFGSDAGAMALLAFAISSWGSSAFYLYRRHKTIGVP